MDAVDTDTVPILSTEDEAKQLAIQILKETGHSVEVIRLRDGRYAILVFDTSKHSEESISELIRTAMLEPIITPPIKFDLDDLVPKADDGPVFLDPDRCTVCRQKRCRVHGPKHRRF